jgi:hypothetical protein
VHVLELLENNNKQPLRASLIRVKRQHGRTRHILHAATKIPGVFLPFLSHLHERHCSEQPRLGGILYEVGTFSRIHDCNYLVCMNDERAGLMSISDRLRRNTQTTMVAFEAISIVSHLLSTVWTDQVLKQKLTPASCTTSHRRPLIKTQKAIVRSTEWLAALAVRVRAQVLDLLLHASGIRVNRKLFRAARTTMILPVQHHNMMLTQLTPSAHIRPNQCQCAHGRAVLSPFCRQQVSDGCSLKADWYGGKGSQGYP